MVIRRGILFRVASEIPLVSTGSGPVEMISAIRRVFEPYHLVYVFLSVRNSHRSFQRPDFIFPKYVHVAVDRMSRLVH